MEIELKEGQYTCCDGVSRRHFIKAGFLGFIGLSVADFLRLREAAAAGEAKAKAAILLYMSGGPSHLDIWDLKPEAPREIRGEFNPIKTNVDGVEISEHLPMLSKHADKFAILRSVTHSNGSHGPARHWMQTGFSPSRPFAGGQRVNEYPGYGAMVAKELGWQSGMPPYVALIRPLLSGAGGPLGSAYDPFTVEGDPAAGNFKVRDLILPEGVSLSRFERRQSLLKAVDNLVRKIEANDALASMDVFYQKAYEAITSTKARSAFDLSQEPKEVRDRYGRTSFGQSCLLARRLVEAGVRFVSIDRGGWDTHGNNFPALKNNLLPEQDRAFSALLEELHQRGLLESTLVIWMGEFGRTPKINGSAGRDHWPSVLSVVMAGGGVRGGQVVGASNERAEFPKDRPIRPSDIAATIYAMLGIDYNKEYETVVGRPMKVVEDGEPIRELLG